MPYPGRLAPQQRSRALADLKQVITKAEANRDRHRQAVSALSGADRKRAEVYLRIAEERLAQLYRSREVLLDGEQSEEAAP
jgi:hypothetical protein